MDYLATFHTHYGAMCFQKHCKKNAIPSRMMPVPRELSASCGVCVRFEADCAPQVQTHEDMETCYTIGTGDVYRQIEG